MPFLKCLGSTRCRPSNQVLRMDWDVELISEHSPRHKHFLFLKGRHLQEKDQHGMYSLKRDDGPLQRTSDLRFEHYV